MTWTLVLWLFLTVDGRPGVFRQEVAGLTQAACERARDVEARRPVPDVRVVAFCVEAK